MESSKVKIDWVSVTATWGVLEGIGIKLHLIEPYREAGLLGKGMYGYNASYAFPSGLKLLFHEGMTRNDLCHMQVGGKLLDVARTQGLSDNDIAEAFNVEGAKITRFDLALDLMNSPYSLLALGSIAIQPDGEQKASGRPMSRTRIHSIGGKGDTIYIGSWNSDRMMCCYDKGAQQGGAPDEWYRFEVRLKDARARWALDVWLKGREVGATEIQIWRHISQGMVDHPYFGTIEHADGALSEFTHETGQKSTTWRWLMGQVRAALMKRADEDGTAAVMDYIAVLCGDLSTRGVRVITPYGEVLGGDTDGSIPDAPEPVKP